jgi:large subunit ribosomal protein L6
LFFFVELFLQGIGFRCEVTSLEFLLFDLGFSHRIKLKIPKEIKVKSSKGKILVFSKDKAKLGLFVAMLKDLRYPDPYKGKGILFLGEELVLKVGKKR